MYQPFTTPAAWRVGDLGCAYSFAYELSSRERSALLDALKACASLPLAALTPATFPLALESLPHWVDEVKTGRGLVWLRNMPVDELDPEEAGRLFFGLGSYFGTAVSQSNDGELVGHVINVGGQDPRERAYRNARQLQLHTDRCDYIGMLCLRPAATGGVSGYASALTIHNEILATRPHLMDTLYQGFHLHRFGETIDGPPITPAPIPVFSVTDGVPNIVYIRGYIDLAVDEGHYELTSVQAQALDYFDEVSNRPDIRLDLALEPGDATLTNNCVLLHRRTAFEDHEDAARRRHLLRLWLMDPDLPACAAVLAHKSMKGIEKIAGRGTYYQGPGYTDEHAPAE
ncbi:MAG: hypothetical protein GKR94_34550 [Gammaproteobacteria bacterium]|nr:hypothetical protein [Gammaproteobacteria bacterium]